ncbi:MAG: hypothetical protein ABI237_06040 [Ginsengibacter sp.]
MIWRFSILDRNNVITVIDEPTGWDSNVSQITRDANWHGIFFNSQGDEFEYEGLAMEMIKAEKEKYGTEGNLTLIMEEDCGQGFEEFSRGRFDFSKYEHYCGEDCYIKIPVENVSEVIDLRNRINQEVNLESLIAFDETTALAPYDKLAFELSLPSKGIQFINKLELDVPADTVELTEADLLPVGLFPNLGWFQIVPQFEKTLFSEFGVMSNLAGPEHTVICSGNDDISGGPCPDLYKVRKLSNATSRIVYFDWAQASAMLINDNNQDNFDAIDKFDFSFDYSMEIAVKDSFIVYLNAVVLIYRADGTFEELRNTPIVQATFDGPTSWNPVVGTFWTENTTHTVSVSEAFSGISLQQGDYLFVALAGMSESLTGLIGNGANLAYTITSISGHVEMQTLSHTNPTPAKVFAVNEVISRISESLTNGRLRAYSNYFGRKDSQPYAAAEDGCGSLEVITDGLRIRRVENRTNLPGQTSVFAVSLQDVFNGLNPIHNMGIGIEPDPNRTGFNWMRIEPWHFFYNTAVVLSCTGINQITHKTNEKEIYSTFQFGYGKWEAQQYNGLDEFLTKRGYRTTLSRVKNDFSQISTFIGSGYALEVTRRKGNIDSTDYTYDNDTFIICIKRGFRVDVISPGYVRITPAVTLGYSGDTITFTNGGSINGTFDVIGLHVEPEYVLVNLAGFAAAAGAYYPDIAVNGVAVPNDALIVESGNIAFPKNIVDPDTVYNFRISPVRNGMRWMNKIFESYELFNTDAKVIFTDGDANYFAAGEIANGVCKIENVPIAENVTIDSTIYSDTNDCRPFMKADRVTYDYPMSSKDYKFVEANPYGLIYFENDCEEGLGWIDTISYKPEDGIASFSLIPAVNVDPTGCVPVAIRGDGTLPDGTVGMVWSTIINLYGTAPFILSGITKPSWMVISVSGTTIYLSGTPTDVAVSTVSFFVDNCDAGNTAAFSGTVNAIAPTIACTAVAITGTPVLPDANTNTAYNYSFGITGDAPFALASIVKPGWMNIAIVGNNVVFSGTPLTAATGLTVSFDITNCSGINSVSFPDTIDVIDLCVNVTVPDTITLPDGVLSTPYSYSIALGGTVPFVLDTIVKPSWMSIDVVVNNIVFSGTPDVVATGLAVSFNVTNCSAGTGSVSDTINVNWSDNNCNCASMSEVIGDGIATQYDIAHTFATRNVIVSVRSNSTPWDEVITDNECPDANTVRVIFNVAPATDAYTVTIFAHE